MRTFLALMLLIPGLRLNAEPLSAVEVVPGIYGLVGPLSQRAPDNLGNNATFGLVITENGAVLIDAGGSYRGAEMLHETIRALTDQPVVTVINTGGQDHRWLGNEYWHQQGAQIVAAAAAAADQEDRASMQLTALAARIGAEALAGTNPLFADVTFTDSYAFDLGGVSFELLSAPGHTPGDTIVWVPEQSVVFTGDLVFSQRLLGVLEVSSSRNWVESFERMAGLEPAHVIPGHGAPTDLARARHDTYDYLVALRTGIGALIDAGGDILAAPQIDQSAFADIPNFDTLAGRNAQAVFAEMEWE